MIINRLHLNPLPACNVTI